VCFAPLAETLFFAARPFHPPKNASLGPRVPMSTFSKPSEPMLPWSGSPLPPPPRAAARIALLIFFTDAPGDAAV
jgi:hypothetical protein